MNGEAIKVRGFFCSPDDNVRDFKISSAYAYIN